MIDSYSSTQESVPEGKTTMATFQNTREVNIGNATFVLNAGVVEGPSRASMGSGHLDTPNNLPTVTEPTYRGTGVTNLQADTSANSPQAENPPRQEHVSAAVLVTDPFSNFQTTRRRANVGSRVQLTVRADHDIYYSQLLVKGRGSPMWIPGPDLNLPEEYRREGAMIGDVGILYNLEGFSFLFNIFLPADHPINIGRVPDDFEPLDFSRLRHEVKKQTVFGRGDYLASSSMQKLDSVDSSNLIFEASATEGAVLTMPEGATTEDLMSRKSIRQYVAKNAESWYWFVREVREREVENGDIRLVVGCDRVSSWGIATFASSIEHQVRLEFKARDDVSETHSWNCVGSGNGRVGPYEEDVRDLRTDTAELKNQCVFLRTLNFNLAGEIWNNLVVHRVRSLYASPQGDKGESGRQPGSSGEGPGGGESSSTHGVTFQGTQFGLSVIHPANPINKCLMEKYPEARIAITEDEDWMSVISQQDIVFPGPDELCTRLLATREISEEDGVVTFKTQEVSPRIENKQLLSSDSSQHSSSKPAQNVAAHFEDFLVSESVIDTPPSQTSSRTSSTLLQYQAHRKDAETMYKRTPASKEQAIGPEHTSTLDTVINYLGKLKSTAFTASKIIPQQAKPDLTHHTTSATLINSSNDSLRDLTSIEEALQSHYRTYHVRDGAITSGTLEGLVEFLIVGFSLPGHIHYRDNFLTACSELTTPEDLFQIISRRLSEEDQASDDGSSTQYTIFMLIVYWLSSDCFSPNEELLYRMKFFCEEAILMYPRLSSIAKETRDLINLKMARPELLRASNPREPILRASDMTPRNLAIALGLLEGDHYKALQPSDYLQYLSKGHSDRVNLYIKTNEKIKLWVIKSILYYDTASGRSEVVIFFINTAFECYSMRNFSSTAAISGALQSVFIENSRATMKAARKALSKKVQAKLPAIYDIVNPHSNYRGYYEAIQSAVTTQELDTCIPWLAVHLKELDKVVRQSLTVKVDDQHLVNFSRHNRFMDRIKEILYYSPPNLEDKRDGGQLTYLLNQLRDIELSGDLEQQLLARSEMLSTRESKNHKENLRLVGFAV